MPWPDSQWSKPKRGRQRARSSFNSNKHCTFGAETNKCSTAAVYILSLATEAWTACSAFKFFAILKCFLGHDYFHLSTHPVLLTCHIASCSSLPQKNATLSNQIYQDKTRVVEQNLTLNILPRKSTINQQPWLSMGTMSLAIFTTCSQIVSLLSSAPVRYSAPPYHPPLSSQI